MVEYLLAIVFMVYYPFMALIAGEKPGAAEPRVLFLVRLSNTFVFVTGALLMITGRFLIPAVFGQSFDRSYGLFLVCLPGLLTGSASTFFTAYYFGTARLRINLTSALILILTSLALSGLLIPRWPLYGAAWTFSIANLAAFVYEMVMFRRITAFSLNDFLLLNRPDVRQSIAVMLRQSGQAEHFSE
jgi:O-antigen/teichoic acid export membrane protein